MLKPKTGNCSDKATQAEKHEEDENMTLKVVTLVGTRPEIIKLCRVMHELDKHTHHILVHSGQNYDFELNEVFFRELEIRKPDYFLEAAGETAAQTIGNVITRIDHLLEKENPDAFLVLGDTNTCLGAIAAKRRKIPIFHMEAGNRCFDDRVPEEINRRIIDHMSDINLPYTEHARRYLLMEGLRPETIIKTGSPMMEVLKTYWARIDAANVLNDLGLENGEYFVFSAHREENVDHPVRLKAILKILSTIVDKYQKTVIVSTHPRTRKGLDSIGGYQDNKRIRFSNPFGFFEYVKLQMNAFCVISDSGSLTEESSILNLPAIMIREAHERPEGMDEGTVIMCGLKPNMVLKSIEIARAHHTSDGRIFKIAPDYDAENVSKKVLRIIMSYTDYVNRTVWFK
jgi:UDP-N-acetylglucosamine 2-epimerase